MSVVEVDFGKERNEFARRLGKLLNMVEERDKDIGENPLKYLEMLEQKYVKVLVAVEEAKDALRPPLPTLAHGPIAFEPFKTVVVDADELKRLRECAAILGRI
jgi:3-dehydroquinate synthase class II